VRSQIGRYALATAVAFLLLLGLLLLVRPLIYSVAPPRDDSVYAVATTASVPTTAPLVKDLLLNTSHRLLGERRNGEHAAITVVISRSPSGLFSVVNAWSPVDDCGLTLREDRLVDCRSHAWTFAGAPFSSGDRPLQAFPVTNQNGSLIVDFTHPVDAEG
jgi:hypothetical protein